MIPLADPDDLTITAGLRELNVERAAALIEQASAAVRSHCNGRTFLRVEDDEVTLDGHGGRILLLPDYPVESVTEVVADGIELTYPADYSWSRNGTLRRRGGRWPDELGSVRVVYTHGAAPDVIADIRGVVIAATARAYLSPEETEPSIGDEPNSEAVGFATAIHLLPSERRILDRHRDLLA